MPRIATIYVYPVFGSSRKSKQPRKPKKPKETYLEAVKSRALYHRVPMKMVWENLRDGANNQS